MFNRTRYDVLIAGARCAGAATAMLLARSGLRVLAVDHGSYATDTLSTHALMRGGVLQLHRWGVLPRIVAAGTPPIRRTTFHYGEAVTEVILKPGQGIDALYAPRRTVLDRTLVDEAREASAEVRYGCIVTDVLRDRSGRVCGAMIRRSDGRHTEVAADLVIGADGVGSSIARLVEAPVTRSGAHAAATIYAHWSDLPDTGYRWHYRAGLSVGIIPTNGGQHCVFVAIPQGQYRDHAHSGLAALYQRILQQVVPEVAQATASSHPESRLWTFPGRKGFQRQPCGPGWALVGDAGYFKDPLTAHGITDALRDAELLARAAAQGTDAALANYAAVRDDLSGALFDATDAIASFGWDLPELQTWHARLNRAMKREVEYLAALPSHAPPGHSDGQRQAPTVRRSARQLEEFAT
jgi:2-polyprenyl-6-methoxyphenol hydroxylase-like FAD-dependent oxidoreductase